MVDSDERGIMTKCVRHPGVVVFGVLAVLMASAGVIAGQENGGTVALDVDDIGGVVTGPHGPEAGVWVIAETSDLPTGFRKIVVTDQQGRYLVPDLPEATYRVWVRGYGLVDSADVTATPGQSLDLTAVVAPDPAAAAAYYPANYWLSLLEVPPKSDFPGTGPQGNGIGENMRSQGDWIAQLRSGCTPCHQLGTKATRELPPVFRTFDSTRDAWHQRVQSGQQGMLMSGMLADFGRDRALELFADWTDRVMAGELPPVPPRPQGLERHVVITQWDWADEFTYVHDITTTDKRDPTVNANGLVYSNDRYNHPDLNILDPVRHTVRKAVTLTVRDSGDAACGAAAGAATLAVPRRGVDLDESDRHAQPDDGPPGPDLDDAGPAAVGQAAGLVPGGIDASVGAILPAGQQRSPGLGLRSGGPGR